MKLIFGLGLIALVGYWPAAKTPKRVNSLFLQNVEALAGSEHVTNLGCLGDGSVDCPINHIKVEYVVQGFSLGSECSFI
ncbi:NVEALA domain-containing protein [Bacteroides fragilis]|nr:NVEALA domain-containing protein [Bacteroides fragilis]